MSRFLVIRGKKKKNVEVNIKILFFGLFIREVGVGWINVKRVLVYL